MTQPPATSWNGSQKWKSYDPVWDVDGERSSYHRLDGPSEIFVVPGNQISSGYSMVWNVEGVQGQYVLMIDLLSEPIYIKGKVTTHPMGENRA